MCYFHSDIFLYKLYEYDIPSSIQIVSLPSEPPFSHLKVQILILQTFSSHYSDSQYRVENFSDNKFSPVTCPLKNLAFALSPTLVFVKICQILY